MGNIDELADRVFAAIEAGDRAAVAEIWADDAEIWHNFDRITQSKEQNLATLDWMCANTTSRSYDEVRRTLTETGFVQQHVLRLGFADGRTAEIPACVIAEIRDGKVVRVDEYLDSAQADAAFRPR